MNSREQHSYLEEAIDAYSGPAVAVPVASEPDVLCHIDRYQLREHSDSLVHTLSELVIELEAMRALWSHDPHRAYAILERVRQTSRSSLSMARTLLRDLHECMQHDGAAGEKQQ